MSDKDLSPPRIAVVVPVKNEADNILPLLGEITAALSDRWPFEIVYVDDGSDDETPAVLAAAKRDFPQLRLVRHRESCGQSQAVATGVKAARAPYIATLDGDGQNDPADIPALFERFLSASESDRDLLLIAGFRQKRQDNGLRRLSSKVANGIRASLLNDATPDSGCGLKLFSRDAFLDMPRFNHMHRFLPALMIRRGGDVVSVRVNHRPRERGVSKYGLWNRLWVGIVDLFGVMWLQRRASVPIIDRRD
ncbi:glycosyltransferase family 2 protein [Telmatospirillum siberiense]|uniref:Dolichol-phosphate mannosyltransferase n=1 Tax=Telmatospirillum siberiense TaxID=382514 RepID=A0A2N3Q082_9PROT|nr:glycosyltransferase family 2 protein [Telmatospirillum siberiense]PKU26056.1 dolichol-phosphate mannosyltransferase [Telmatospirillum siberiense]